MLLKFSSQFIARCNHLGLPFVSEEFVEATDSTAQPAVAISAWEFLHSWDTKKSHVIAFGLAAFPTFVWRSRGLNFVSEEFVEATDSTAQPAVAIWACCSRFE